MQKERWRQKMKYHDEVALSIKTKVLNEKLEEVQKTNSILAKRIVDLFNMVDEHLTKDEWSLYIWRNIKWNDGPCECKEMFWIRCFMEECEDTCDEIDDLPFRFVRLGENLIDVEVLGTYEEPFRVGFVKELIYRKEMIH